MAAFRSLTPNAYATDPAVRAQVDDLCSRFHINPKDACEILVNTQRVIFYERHDDSQRVLLEVSL